MMSNLEQFIMDNCKDVPESKLYDRYDEMLNECNDIVRIGSLEYMPADVLHEVDPTAYRCGFSDWLDAEGYVELGGLYYDRGDYDDCVEAFEAEGNRND